MRRFAFVLLITAAPAGAETLQERLLAGARAQSPESVAFTRTTRVEQRSGDAPAEVRTRIERFDPARAPGQRWTLVSVDGRAPTANEQADAAKRNAEAPPPGYQRAAHWLGAKAVCDAQVCLYAALPKGTVVINGHDISADTQADVTVGGTATSPFVERSHFLSTKPFRMMLVAKVARVEATASYKLLSGRIVVPIQSELVMTGSMMGKAGTMRTTTTYSDWRAVSPSR